MNNTKPGYHKTKPTTTNDDCLLRHPAWRQNRPIFKGKDKGAVNKKGKYKHEKKQITKSKQKQVIRQTNT